ncbi:MAG TPA: BLUF domain-containing protein [Roseivirga sp.]
MLTNLIYVSIRTPECSDTDIQNILKSSNKNNVSLDVTGVLLYTSNRFIQFLEGPYDQVTQLYHNIKTDPRHKNVILLSLQKDVSDKRIFPKWAMGGKGFGETDIEFDSDLSTEERKEFVNLINGHTGNAQTMVNAIKKVFK